MNLPFKGRTRVTQIWKKDAHFGFDCVGDDDKTVICVAAGVVVASKMVTDRSNRTWEWGNYVCVKADDGKHYYYCHLDSRVAKVGTRVAIGDTIGIMGNTGKSFGSHLHLQVRDKYGREINVADVLGVTNKLGTYSVASAPTTPKPQLWLATVGQVSKGDKAALEALAWQLQVPCKTETKGCTIGLSKCVIGPVSNGDLIAIQALAKKLDVPCIVKET